MKTISVIIRSLREQIRSYWILLLSVLMGPFFIMVYYLILETSKPKYDIVIVNGDTGVITDGKKINHGEELTVFLRNSFSAQKSVPLNLLTAASKEAADEMVSKKDADAVINIDGGFSYTLEKQKNGDKSISSTIEFSGDLTSSKYLISAVWANESVNDFMLQQTGAKRLIEVRETALGNSGKINEFDMMVPGILVLSLIMLMFTASIAFVSEVENRTIIRLKLSMVTTFEYLAGISVVQLVIGILSLLLTLVTAGLLGFNYTGSLTIMILIAILTSLSLIAFSLIIAAVTRSANEVLIVGNFPMFLFMFFTGAAFPFKSNAIFTIGGYPVSFQGLMSPTHAISALNKTLVLNMDLKSIIPEIISILILTIIYFITGALIFNRRHLRIG